MLVMGGLLGGDVILKVGMVNGSLEVCTGFSGPETVDGVPLATLFMDASCSS